MLKRKFDQHGIAHLALIALLAVVIAAVGFTAWRVMGTKNNKAVVTNSTTPAKVATTSTGSNCGTEQLDAADFSYSASADINSNSSSTSVSSNSTSGLTIANKCFNTAFKDCKAASLVAVANFKLDGGGKADEQTDYAITGPKTGGCEVKETFTKSTILPANLVGTDLICTDDNTLIFTDALSKTANTNFKGCTGSYMKKSGFSTTN